MPKLQVFYRDKDGTLQTGYIEVEGINLTFPVTTDLQPRMPSPVHSAGGVAPVASKLAISVEDAFYKFLMEDQYGKIFLRSTVAGTVIIRRYTEFGTIEEDVIGTVEEVLADVETPPMLTEALQPYR